MRLEVVLLPVSDVERAKEFYVGLLGWRLDADVAGEGFLVVSDIEAVRAGPAERGVEVSRTFHRATGLMCRFRTQGDEERADGPARDHTSYGTFASFRDPDGNSWLLQEVTFRLPGRVGQSATSFGTAAELAAVLRRAAAAHGEHEKRTGEADPNWPDWYAEYIVQEQTGGRSPS
jgi:catechol 2,3-dioxygenase-like lactoylglutathione lyase family enzyme